MDREGQRTVFVRYRSLKNRQKKICDRKSHLCEEEDEAWTGWAPACTEKSIYEGLFCSRLSWIGRMLQRGAGDSWEHRSSWFCEWSAHVTGTLKCAPLSGRVRVRVTSV